MIVPDFISKSIEYARSIPFAQGFHVKSHEPCRQDTSIGKAGFRGSEAHIHPLQSAAPIR